MTADGRESMTEIAETTDTTMGAVDGSDVADDAGTTGPMNPDQLAELEEERRFLLRSLADLERELAAGDVDHTDYEALRDGYTSRAAAVLRSIDAGRSALAPPGPRNIRRIVAITLAVVLLGAGLGVLVARFASPRGSGDTITGGTDDDRIAALLSDARSALFNTEDLATATDSYRDVLDIEPQNVEARAYLGWVLVLAAQQLAGDARTSALAAGKQSLVEAIETDPTYADSYCFLAVIAAQFENDVPTATTRRDDCLSHDPSSDMQRLMIDFVEPMTNPAPDSSGVPGSLG